MNWKGFGKKWLWPNLRYYPCMYLGRLRRTTRNLSQDSWYLSAIIWGFWAGITVALDETFADFLYSSLQFILEECDEYWLDSVPTRQQCRQLHYCCAPAYRHWSISKKKVNDDDVLIKPF
jgi:hypothetical protein